MRTLILLFLVFLVACNPKGKPEEKEEWIQLFNGTDLTGWDLKIKGYELNDNYANTFRVEDSLLKVRYDGYEEFTDQYGHIFYNEIFSHYKLRVEYRFVGEQVPGGQGWAWKNSGAMLHGQTAASMGIDQSFPVCIEAQFLGGDGVNERSTANLCTPGTHVYMADTLVTQHCINSSSKTYHGEEWVSTEFIVLGDSIIYHLVEGDTVLVYTRPHIGGDLPEGFPYPEGTRVKDGTISLQSESHPIDFRKVELLDLSDKYK
ncbi:MAG: DUF1080 domain-containing protein [Bacteroidales bacterium]|nr:DUF1080 domain-containing protein [Bacteroidales bacterium]